MNRRWVDRCRHCSLEHEERTQRAWLRWYKVHLSVCGAFQAASRAARPRLEELYPLGQALEVSAGDRAHIEAFAAYLQAEPPFARTWPWLPEDLEPLPEDELGVSHAG